MTCIVAIAERGKIMMGGDSAGVSGLDMCDRLDAKVFARDGLLIGFTWSFRMGQLLRYKLKFPQHAEGITIDEYLATSFVDAVRECFKLGGFAQKEKDAENGGEFLIGYRGRLFHVYSDYQVAERRESFDSCGCGADYALGSLFSTDDLKPRNRILQALRAAERFSAGVRRPFKILAEDCR